MKSDSQFIAQKIRAQYMEKEVSELDELRRLDKEVKLPVNIFAYVFGSVGALVMGAGMSMAMGVIGNAMIPGIVIGCVGIGMVSLTYTIYSKILARRREKCRDRILSLSEEIINK